MIWAPPRSRVDREVAHPGALGDVLQAGVANPGIDATRGVVVGVDDHRLEQGPGAGVERVLIALKRSELRREEKHLDALAEL